MPTLTCTVTIPAPRQTVWERFTAPEHVTQWYFAADTWHAPRATNDLRVGGEFTIRMEERDGPSGFDFTGTYTAVQPPRHLAYALTDGRVVHVDFAEADGATTVTETFDTEDANADEQQRAGWQAILDNFKRYCERD